MIEMDLARKLLENGKPSEALERLKKLLPTAQEEWRVHELIGACFHDLCDAEGAAQAYLNAAMKDKYLRSQRAHFSNYIFALHYLTQLDAQILINELKIYNSLYRDVKTLSSMKTVAEKISVAFIAPNFCDSSSARFYEALLTDHDREKFKVTAWSLSKEEDVFTKKIRRNVDGYFEIEETSFEEAAIQIRESGADILVDLGGHTEGGTTLQIAAYKPARIQIAGIGYFDSTGLDATDYFIGDDFLTINDEIFTEKILCLKNAFAFQPNERMIYERKARRPFPHKNFTFGSLNNFMKLSDDYLSTVKIILDALPDAKIIFRDTTPLKSRQDALTERLETLGIKNFEVRRGSNDYFTDYSEIDLILDTFPYPGGMMTALALYMGVPVLNLCGELPHTRTGADILRIADVEELIVYDVDTYISKAVELANNRAKLSTLTGKISIDKLTDTKTFVEDFYGEIYELARRY
jgi:predicted O-linked N-acetylglucosamine transferase (SPINDLY family)